MHRAMNQMLKVELTSFFKSLDPPLYPSESLSAESLLLAEFYGKPLSWWVQGRIKEFSKGVRIRGES